MFKLTSVNMQNVSAPMGQASTSINYVFFFLKFENAVAYAEKDYGNSLEFERRSKYFYSTGDLLHVMYEIDLVKVEDENNS